MTEELPEPNEEMSPEEKGELLLHYVKAGWAVGDIDDVTHIPVRKDFSNAKLESADLEGAMLWGIDLRRGRLTSANLNNAKLDSGNLEEAELWGASLQGASLHSTILDKAILSGARLNNADFSGARLAGANLGGAHLIKTNLQWTDIEGADFMESYLRGVNLSGAEGTPGDRRSAHIDAETYLLSQWTPAHLTEWLRAGAVLENIEEFPPEAQARILGEKEGLSLHFKSQLSEADRIAVDLVVLAYRQCYPDSDVRIVEYQVDGDMSFLRLQASDPADLLFLAIALYQRIWEAQSNRNEQRPSSAQELSRELSVVSSQMMLRQLSWLISRGDRFELWSLVDGRLKKKKEWRPPKTRHGVLCDLLLLLFTSEHDFAAFLSNIAEAPRLRESLPSKGEPMVSQVDAAVRALVARGLVDKKLFLRLAKERPRRTADIACAALSWDIVVPVELRRLA